jgi:hypothetical protein
MGTREIKEKVESGVAFVERVRTTALVGALEEVTPAKLSEPLGELTLEVTRLQHVHQTDVRPIGEMAYQLNAASKALEEVSEGDSEAVSQVTQKSQITEYKAISVLEIRQEQLGGSLSRLERLLGALAEQVGEYKAAYNEAVQLAQQGVGMQTEFRQKAQEYLTGLQGE